ncbi:MFS transporter [Aestuariibius sp. 2305UL40-4]|uniref:MFS transporter n=1 Tax=Aestuariibius violaceus TaxID=3234132 RepID=UPI00345EA988
MKQNSSFLPLLVVSRVCATAVFMTYAACLVTLMEAWDMTAAQAGAVQAGFTAAFAVSLLVASLACDRLGPKFVYRVSTVLVALTALAFAVYARSQASALLLVSLIGLAQGGTYTPALMLASANVPAARKSSAMGWVLSGMSAGYVISIIGASTMLEWFDYRAAFLLTALVSVLGVPFGHLATARVEEPIRTALPAAVPFSAFAKRQTVLLTIGYVGHCWELFGAWAWVPAFVASSLLLAGETSFTEIGIWTACALHLTGFFSSILSGYASDRFGARSVLIGFAFLGMLCSFILGWLPAIGPIALMIVVAIYGFVIIGDSAVLSAAMTDTVPAHKLGAALGVRSVLGIGSGALAPISFGITLDVLPETLQWPGAFAVLGLGGFVALICALLLRKAD